MAKNNMKLKYKQPKRDRNKKKLVSENEDAKSIVKTFTIVLVTMGILYLCVLGMEKIGVFEAGYTKPESEEVTLDYEFIDIGTIFNRDETEYYVLFDNYKSDYTKSTYINNLIDSEDTKVYKVDMSLNENEKYISEEGNSSVQEISDLKINGVTLIKIRKGKNVKYIEGKDNIEEYLK